MLLSDLIGLMKELGSKASLSSSDKSAIEHWYREALGRTFVRTSCGDCYRDAAIEIYSYLKRNGKMKEKSNYALKNGVVLQMGFGSNEMYTNANLTDESAEKYLAKFPGNVKFFSKYPKNWKERAKKRTVAKEKKSEGKEEVTESEE